MNINNSSSIEEVIPVGKANQKALMLLIPIAIAGFLPFILLNGLKPLVQGIVFLGRHQLYFFVGLLVTIVLHELLHGLTWAAFTQKGIKSIKFGIKWQYLTPYCQCLEPLKRWQYLLGGLMPGLGTGIIPMLVSWITANGWLLFVSVFLTTAAIGDFMMIIRVLRYSSNCLFLDHPNEIGFIVFKY